jgi:hypothetical protein
MSIGELTCLEQRRNPLILRAKNYSIRKIGDGAILNWPFLHLRNKMQSFLFIERCFLGGYLNIHAVCLKNLKAPADRESSLCPTPKFSIFADKSADTL